MRIYEIAKEAGVTSAEVLRAAEAAGIEASNAISSVDADEAGKLRAAVQGASSSAVEQRKAKLSKAAELNAQFFAEQKARLEEHLKIAKLAAEGGKAQLKSKVEVEVRSGHLPVEPKPPAPRQNRSRS